MIEIYQCITVYNVVFWVIQFDDDKRIPLFWFSQKGDFGQPPAYMEHREITRILFGENTGWFKIA
jgi:hypothetical protein